MAGGVGGSFFPLVLFMQLGWLVGDTCFVLQEVIEMFSLTHVDEADTDLPQCLWDWTPPAHDLADGPFHRDDCLEPSTEPKQPRQKMKLCECHVLRNSKRVLESFKAPECL